MPSTSRPLATQQQWHDVAQSIFFIWQFGVGSYAVFIASTLLIWDGCCYERPPESRRVNPRLVGFLVASFCIVCSIVIEAHMFIAGRLSKDVRLGFEVVKSAYVCGVFAWFIGEHVVGKKGHPDLVRLWWWITWRTVVYATPFLIALAYAIYVKVKSRRRRVEEEPLLGHVE